MIDLGAFFSVELARFDSPLLKFNLTKEMAGNFVCVSENSAGKISKSIRISYNGKI